MKTLYQWYNGNTPLTRDELSKKFKLPVEIEEYYKAASRHLRYKDQIQSELTEFEKGLKAFVSNVNALQNALKQEQLDENVLKSLMAKISAPTKFEKQELVNHMIKHFKEVAPLGFDDQKIQQIAQAKSIEEAGKAYFNLMRETASQYKNLMKDSLNTLSFQNEGEHLPQDWLQHIDWTQYSISEMESWARAIKVLKTSNAFDGFFSEEEIKHRNDSLAQLEPFVKALKDAPYDLGFEAGELRNQSDDFLENTHKKQEELEYLKDVNHTFDEAFNDLNLIKEDIEKKKKSLDQVLTDEPLVKLKQEAESVSDSVKLYDTAYNKSFNEFFKVSEQYTNIENYFVQNKDFLTEDEISLLLDCQKELSDLKKLESVDFKALTKFSLISKLALKVQVDVQNRQLETQENLIRKTKSYKDLVAYRDKLQNELENLQREGKNTTFSTTQKIVDAITECIDNINNPEQYSNIVNAPSKLKATIDKLKVGDAEVLVNNLVERVGRIDQDNDPLKSVLVDRKKYQDEIITHGRMLQAFSAYESKEHDKLQDLKKKIMETPEWEALTKELEIQKKELEKNISLSYQKIVQNKIKAITSFQQEVENAKSNEEISRSAKKLNLDNSIDKNQHDINSFINTRSTVFNVLTLIKNEIGLSETLKAPEENRSLGDRAYRLGWKVLGDVSDYVTKTLSSTQEENKEVIREEGDAKEIFTRNFDGLSNEDNTYLKDNYETLYDRAKEDIFGKSGFVEQLKRNAQYFYNRKTEWGKDGDFDARTRENDAQLKAAIQHFETMGPKEKDDLIHLAMITRLKQKESGVPIQEGEGENLSKEKSFYFRFCMDEKLYDKNQKSLKDYMNAVGMAPNDPDNVFIVKPKQDENNNLQAIVTFAMSASGAYVGNVVGGFIPLVGNLSGAVGGSVAGFVGTTAAFQKLREDGIKVQRRYPFNKGFAEWFIENNDVLSEGYKNHPEVVRPQQILVSDKEFKLEDIKTLEDTKVKEDNRQLILEARAKFEESLNTLGLEPSERKQLLDDYENLHANVSKRIAGSEEEPGFKEQVESTLDAFEDNQRPYLDKVKESERKEYLSKMEQCRTFSVEMFNDMEKNPEKKTGLVNEILLNRIKVCKENKTPLTTNTLCDKGEYYKDLYTKVLGQNNKTFCDVMSDVKMLTENPKNQIEKIKYPIGKVMHVGGVLTAVAVMLGGVGIALSGTVAAIASIGTMIFGGAVVLGGIFLGAAVLGVLPKGPSLTEIKDKVTGIFSSVTSFFSKTVKVSLDKKLSDYFLESTKSLGDKMNSKEEFNINHNSYSNITSQVQKDEVLTNENNKELKVGEIKEDKKVEDNKEKNVTSTIPWGGFFSTRQDRHQEEKNNSMSFNRG